MSDRLADLRARFRLRAARDLDRLPGLVTADPNSDDLRGLAHNTAGAAGTFGFGALSRAAIVIDDCYARDVTPDPEAFQELARALAVVAAGAGDD